MEEPAKDPVSPLKQRLLRPFGWPFFTMLGLLVLGILWLSTKPSYYYMLGAGVILYAWLAVLLVILLRIFLHAILVYALRVAPEQAPFRFGRMAAIMGILLAVSAITATKLPMQLAFRTAQPALDEIAASFDNDTIARLEADLEAWPYTISADRTNRRLDYQSTSGPEAGRLLLFLGNDKESAFIYSRNGIDGLAYNEGNKGHLTGDWYWMAED